MSVLSFLELRFLPSASLSDFEVCFPNAQGDDDSEYRSGPALCQRHAGAIATLASYCNGKQTQSVASLLSRSSCQILQGKRFVEDGTDARYSFLLNPLSNTVHYCDAATLTEYASLSNLQTTTRYRLHGPWRETGELACQRRTDHATAVRCPGL